MLATVAPKHSNVTATTAIVITHGNLSRMRASVKIYYKLECGPMPNLTVALPNIDGALCSMPQSLADAHY